MKQNHSFSAVKDEALRQIESLCRRLLPQGQRKGSWWFARVPWRADKTPSLGVSLTTGFWRDWGSPGDEGGIIDLFARLDGCTAAEAKDRLAGLLGMGEAVANWKPKPRVVVSCADCAHQWKRFHDRYYCTVVVDTLNEEPWPCATARRQGLACGPDGKLWLLYT